MRFAPYLASAAASYGDKDAIICGDTTITFAQLHHASTCIASALQENGVCAGDRVGIYLKNCAEFLVCFLGIVKAGGVAVPINLKLARPEVTFILEDAQAAFIFVGIADIDELVLASAGLSDSKKIVVGPRHPAAFMTYAEVIDMPPKPLHELPVNTDVCMISYTSGTTGRPKGAMLTQSNYIVMNGFLNALYWDIRHDDRILLTTPLAHRTAFARLGNLLVLGVTLVVLPKFDPEEVASTVEAQRITVLGMVPTVGRLLMPVIVTSPQRFSSLRKILATGESLPVDLRKELADRLPKAEIYSFYSMTEVGAVSLLKPNEQIEHSTSVGKILPGVEVKLVDSAGSEVGLGSVGEVWVRSGEPGRFLTMQGYLNRPEANAESFLNGWFKTGDMAKFDSEGYLYIVDRKKDMVLSGGYNIYTKEVEMALEAHPAVLQAAVIGIPDSVFGEAVVAFVVLKPHQQAEAGELVDWCTKQIASYKKPKYVRFLLSLPQNSGGKIQKRQLAESFLEE